MTISNSYFPTRPQWETAESYCQKQARNTKTRIVETQRKREKQKHKKGNCSRESASKGQKKNGKGRKRKKWKMKNIKIIPSTLPIYPSFFQYT